MWISANEHPQTWQLKEGLENTVQLSAHHRTNQEPTQWSIVMMLWYHYALCVCRCANIALETVVHTEDCQQKRFNFAGSSHIKVAGSSHIT